MKPAKKHAVRKAPPRLAQAPAANDTMYVKLPIAPEAVRKIREHMGAIDELARKVNDGSTGLTEIAATFAESADALYTDLRALSAHVKSLLGK